MTHASLTETNCGDHFEHENVSTVFMQTCFRHVIRNIINRFTYCCKSLSQHGHEGCLEYKCYDQRDNFFTYLFSSTFPSLLLFLPKCLFSYPVKENKTSSILLDLVFDQ